VYKILIDIAHFRLRTQVLTDFKKLQEAKEEMRKHYEETLKKREKESSMNLFKEQEKVKTLDAKIISLDAERTKFEQL
jgi:hypothetical protein